MKSLCFKKRSTAMVVACSLIFTSVTSPSAGASVPDTEISAMEVSDAEFEDALEILESLPEHIKNADPKTYPNYQEELRAEITKLESGDHPIQLQVNWVSCAGEIAFFIAQYGIPVVKVVGVMRKLYKAFGSVRGIISAIRDGRAFAYGDQDTVSAIESLFGIDSVVAACS